MYWLIEDKNKIKQLCEKSHEQAYVEIIPTSNTLHPTQNTICAVFIHPKDDTKGYIIPLNHTETLNLEITNVLEVLNSIGKVYVRDAKTFLHYIKIKHIYSPPPSPHPYIPTLTTAHTHIYANKDIIHSNMLVPIVKHYELCMENYNNYDFNFINNFYTKAALVFGAMEYNGIKVDTTLYKHYYEQDIEEYVYTNYNLNTLTTRPSNTFGGINFPTIKKHDKKRECFIPNNDVFVEMDISAYHPTLLGKMVGWEWDTEDIHESFSKMYKVEYSQAKELTFKQLYGGIFKQYEDLPFFKLVNEYVNKTWEQFNTQGYIECPISGYIFEKHNLEDMNPQKLLNYILQNLETSQNILIMWDILKVLKGKNTKLILYVYDSFLFDVDREEKDVLSKIYNIFIKYGLKVKFKKGVNYNLDS
jgi:hypothetical protein